MTEKERLEEINVEFEYLKNVRKQREPRWKETENYTSTSLYNWDDPTSTSQITPDSITSRPANFLFTLVSGLLGYSISPNLVWFKLSLVERELLNYAYVKDWLEDVEKLLYSEFNRSNLYQEAYSWIESGAKFGHGILMIDEDVANLRLRFSNRKTPEIYVDVNEFDEIDTVYRYYSMTVRQLVSFFGYDNVDAEVQTMYDNAASRNRSINVLHAIFPRIDRDPKRMDNQNLPFASFYVDMDHDKIMQESGYYELPCATFVWQKIPQSGYGDSPAQQALCDILYLNRVEEAQLRVAQKAADPALNVPDEMRGFESVIPGGFNYYSKPDQVITPINTGANYPITLQVKQDIENRIKDWFHVDYFLMLQAQQQQKTATEVMELQGEKAAILSPLIVNLNSAEVAIIQRSFNILYRQGKIPEPPEVLKGSGANLKIDLVGPLAQAQKRYHQSGGVSQSLAMASPVLQISPSSLDYIDGDKLLISILDGNGYPQSALREQDQVDEIRKARVQQQQIQQQQQALQAQSQTIMQNMDRINQPVKPGSVLEDISKQAAGGAKR